MINEFSSIIIRCPIVFIVINGALLYKWIYLILLDSEFMSWGNYSSILIPRRSIPHPYIRCFNRSAIFLHPCLTLKSQMRCYRFLMVAHLTLHFIWLKSCASKLSRLYSTIAFISNSRELTSFMNKSHLITFKFFKILTQHAWIDSLELWSLPSTANRTSLSPFNQFSLSISGMYPNLRSFFFLNIYLYSIRCYYFLESISFFSDIICWLQSSHWI